MSGKNVFTPWILLHMRNCGMSTTAGGRMMAPRTSANQKLRVRKRNRARPYADMLAVRRDPTTFGTRTMSVFLK